MKRTRIALLAAGALIATVGLVSALAIDRSSPAVAGLDPQTASGSDPRQRAQLVEIAVVQPAGASERTFTGVISARVQSNLGFRVPGKVVERLVDVGQAVEAGRPLMRLDREDLDLALAAKNSAVASARALAVQAKADEARYRQLLADGWTTRQKYDQVKAVLDSANAQLVTAEAQARVARNEAGYSVLLADADGIIVETLAEPGQVVAAGQTVVKLAHAGPREATVNLPETVRPVIGSSAQARLYGPSSVPSPARLRQLSDAADPSSRTYEARYVLDGEAAAAPLGATVTIRVAAPASDPEIQVPLGAVLDDGRRPGVWVLDRATSTVRFRPVQLVRVSSETAVISGVSAGDPIVSLGAHLLQEGARVRTASESRGNR